MNRPGARMCKACKEARKSVDFSRPLDFHKPKNKLSHAEQLVACPRCGTLWQTAPPAARASARTPR